MNIREEIRHLAIPINELHTHPSNVRQGDVGAISESLKTHGQYRTIVYQQSTKRILAGNHTYKAAVALGWTHIAATPVICDDQQALRILLTDNKANDLATYDEPELIELLKELAATTDGLEGTLFDGDELDSLIQDNSHFELPTDVDDVPENVSAVSKLGDVWLLGEHRVMCGDSTDEDTVSKLMNDKKADMVFTDPPYGISIVRGGTVGGGTVVGGKVVKATKYRSVINDDSNQTAISAYRICERLNILVQIWWGGNYYASVLPDSSCWIVWDKENTGNFADAELAWTNQPTATRIFKHMWNGMLRASERGAGVRVHPTQKPIALAAWCLTKYGQPADIVLDLFGGSGSTLIAAQETNRIAYLMELDPHYVDVICARYQKHTGIEPILESTNTAHNFLTDANQ